MLEHAAALPTPPMRLRLVDLNKARIDYLMRWPAIDRLACYEPVAENDLPALRPL